MIQRLLSVLWVATLPGCAGALFDGAPALPVPASGLERESTHLSEAMPPALGLSADYVVRIMGGNVACTGTLIDEQRVLTAHHCVAARDRKGGILERDMAPEDFTVELGSDPLPWAEAKVTAIVAPPCGHRGGDGDIAVLVLERPLVGFDTAQLDIDRAPQMGETIDPIGFGRCTLSQGPIQRQERLGGNVSKLGSGHFRLLAGICPGDSGGPALSRDNRVLGVISRSAMDDDPHTREESEFTRLDRWRSLFAASAEVARGTPLSEVPPLECGSEAIPQ